MAAGESSHLSFIVTVIIYSCSSYCYCAYLYDYQCRNYNRSCFCYGFIPQEDATCLSDIRFSADVTDESKKAASRRHVPTSPRGKAALASSHWPRDLDPDYARYRRVC